METYIGQRWGEQSCRFHAVFRPNQP